VLTPLPDSDARLAALEREAAHQSALSAGDGRSWVGARDGIRPVVIVGAGQAGFQVAASLREKGHQGRVVLVGDEPGVPYQRPPLSKAYLSGALPGERLALRPQAFYDKHGIELVCGRAVGIDRDRRRVALADERELEYGHLVLATGTRNRELPVPGAKLDGVLGLL